MSLTRKSQRCLHLKIVLIIFGQLNMTNMILHDDNDITILLVSINTIIIMTAFQIEYVVFLLPPFLFCQYSFHFTDEDTETQSVHETCQKSYCWKGAISILFLQNVCTLHSRLLLDRDFISTC